MAEHYAIPWDWSEGDSGSEDYAPDPPCIGPEDDDRIVCYLNDQDEPEAVWHANAEFMVLAVNNHGRLHEALARLVNQVDGNEWRKGHNGDWACRECKPQSDQLIEGFRCGYHAAAALLAELEGIL